jgi:hypothetical protein
MAPPRQDIPRAHRKGAPLDEDARARIVSGRTRIMGAAWDLSYKLLLPSEDACRSHQPV